MLATPDITWMQKIVGALTPVVVAAVSLANSFGANLNVDQGTKLIALWTALAGVAVVADAAIRHGRSVAQAQAVSASVELSATVPAKKSAAKK